MMQRFAKILFLMCCFIVIVGNLNIMAINISPGNDLFFVYSVAYKDLSWDLSGYHFDAERKSGKITLFTEDKGADRFIKIIPHVDNPEYVFFQPQHSYFVADISGGLKTPGAELQLWDKGENNQAQMFKMIEVTGETNTYYIQNANSGLYLTAHGKSKSITQEERTNTMNDQKWYFKKMEGAAMAPPSDTDYVYAFENVWAKKFIDIPGAAPNQEKQDGELQLWSMDYMPDRYMEIYPADDDYFYIHPLHCTEVWDVEDGKAEVGTDIQLWPQNNTVSQQFKFEYAGEPLTYFIMARNSGKYVDAYLPDISLDGCDIKIYPKNNLDNQRWKLHLYEKFQTPPKDQEFYIKAAYANTYWGLEGTDVETNQNNKKFLMCNFKDEGNRKYKFLSLGDEIWNKMQVQNGNRCVDIVEGSTSSGVNLHLWDQSEVNSQKFAIQFTSPTTFVLRTNCWKTADISCLSGDWQWNGAELIQWDINYNKNQQFQLIYAAGSNKGIVYEFKPIICEPVMQNPQAVDEKLISFNGFNLTDQQKELFNSQKIADGYTFFPDSDGQIILGIYTNSSKGTDIVKVEEKNDIVNVYVKEASLQANDSSTIVKLQTINSRISVKDVNGKNYGYFSLFKPQESDWVDLAKKYAPQLRFHPDEFSYPSPVEGIINRAYKIVPLSTNFTKLTTGNLPELAMNDNGIILEIHRTSNLQLSSNLNLNYEIHYRVGTLNNNDTIEFKNFNKLTTGINPSIAINNHGNVVEAHRHSCNQGIDLRYGALEANNIINFQTEGDFTSGENPSVAINDSNLFIMVNERGDQLEYHFGRLGCGYITFYGIRVPIPYYGSRPSVALNNLSQVVLTYEYKNNIYYLIGQFDGDYKPIIFNNPTYLTTGNHSSIELNDAGDIIEIHETSSLHTRKNSNGDAGLYMMIHYRYGELFVNKGVANPYIEFSNHIELCSGVTPDIVINNQGDLVEIHETSSLKNSELHYRTAKYQRQAVTSLGDLSANQYGYILAQRSEQSWEAPMNEGKRNLKIYVLISKVNDNTEFRYHFFYPQNGSNVLGLELLEHVGDWERVYVTVDSQGNVIGCKYFHHAAETTFTENQIEFVDGTHPVVYSAKGTHASYPNENVSIFKTGDLVSNEGLIWNSYENLEVVKINDDIINNNYWIHWKGLWGSTLNSPASKF